MAKLDGGNDGSSSGGRRQIAAAIEIGVAAAGLGVYLAVLGGMQQWVKLRAAGLPGDLAISGYDTTALLAAGARALAILPIAFCIILVLLEVLERDRPRSDRGLVGRALAGAEAFSLQVLVVSGGVLFGANITAALASARHGTRPASFLELLALECIFLLIASAGPASFIAVRGWWRWRRGRRDQSRHDRAQTSEPGADEQPPPRLLAWSRRLTGRARTSRRVLATAGLLLVVALLAGALLVQLALRHDAGATGWLLAGAAIAAVCAPYVVLALRVAAAVWHTAERVEKSGSIDERVSTLVVQTHQPQRFTRVTIPVGQRLSVDAALLGRADGQMLLGVCRRKSDGTSTAVQMIRIPDVRVPADRVVEAGYTFYREDEPTLLSGALDALGLPAFRPPTIIAPSRSPPANVCGRTPRLPSWIFDRLRSYEPPATPG